MKILIVDDTTVFRAFMERVLEMDGHITLSAENGEFALECLNREKDIEVVVCDLIMPGIDGIEVYRRYLASSRAAGIQPGIPFILLTGAQDIGRLKDAKNLGFFDVLSKPLDYDRLKQTLANAAGRKPSLRHHRLDSYIKTIDDLAKSLTEEEDREGAAYLLKGLARAQTRLNRMLA